MNKAKKNNPVTFIICISLIAGIIVILGVAIFFESRNNNEYDYSYENQDVVYYNDEEYVPKGNLSTILVAGVDKTGKVTEQEYNNAGQSDFIALLVMDRSSKTFKILHINRDAMANIPVLGLTGEKTDTIYAQIALAHAYGDGLKVSCENMVNVVSEYLYGAEIDDYMVFNIDAVGIINDAVGGVEITLDEDFTKYDKQMKKGATLKLTAEQAVLYTRSRKDVGDSSNTERMSRQQKFLKSLILQTDAALFSDKQLAANLFDSLEEYMVTSLNKSQFGGLANKMYSYESDGYITIKGESIKGEEFIEFYSDENDLKAKVIDIFYKKAS